MERLPEARSGENFAWNTMGGLSFQLDTGIVGVVGFPLREGPRGEEGVSLSPSTEG
jgi:hypothetical protein